MRGLNRWVLVAVAGATVGALVLSGCSRPSTDGDTKPAAGNQTAPKAAPANLTITPATGAAKVSTRPSVKVTTDGKLSKVEVTDPAGKAVAGQLAAEQGTWAPDSQLSYNTKYKVTARATNKDGAENTASSDFTTMGQPGKTNGADFQVDSGTVGVGLPIIIRFSYSVPNNMRKAVQDAIQIKTSQPVEGAWKWWSSDELHFRTKDYWQPGTKIQVKAAIGGVDMGNGRYGKRDRTASMTVGPKIHLKADNKTHKALVYKDGKLLKSLPASLGKRSTPSSSGIMLMQEKRYHVVMDSCTYGVCKGEPGYYRTDVNWAVRYTDGGEFVHGAPWSVGDQGSRNVSHGCLNLSTSNAKWFYNLTKPGDIIEIVNTGTKVKSGDGWTDWNLSWDTISKGGVITTKQL